MKLTKRNRSCLYLAVLPSYRTACIRLLQQQMGDELAIYCGPRQLDKSVRTGIPDNLYTPVQVFSIGGKLFVQLGYWRQVIASRTAILDLNPRSISAWTLLLIRRALHRRSLVWGHLHPRAGNHSPTAKLRLLMRRLASGTVLYGYDGVPAARRDLPAQEVWVAPNSLYSLNDMVAVDRPTSEHSPRLVYVGRLVADKKVDIAIKALAEETASKLDLQLDIVGTGIEENRLSELARSLGVEKRVTFYGHIDSPEQLRKIYAGAVCAVSPGYAGLSLTQSLGFGVPVIVADNEPHAPEIELVRLGGVSFFESNSPASLAASADNLISTLGHQNREELSSRVRLGYSAESMANGLLRAIREETQELAEDGWPEDPE